MYQMLSGFRRHPDHGGFGDGAGTTEIDEVRGGVSGPALSQAEAGGAGRVGADLPALARALRGGRRVSTIQPGIRRLHGQAEGRSFKRRAAARRRAAPRRGAHRRKRPRRALPGMMRIHPLDAEEAGMRPRRRARHSRSSCRTSIGTIRAASTLAGANRSSRSSSCHNTTPASRPRPGTAVHEPLSEDRMSSPSPCTRRGRERYERPLQPVPNPAGDQLCASDIEEALVVRCHTPPHRAELGIRRGAGGREEGGTLSGVEGLKGGLLVRWTVTSMSTPLPEKTAATTPCGEQMTRAAP